jgi:UDP-N-acetylglucosamine:LPS N-acetylglucosamine transferase
MKIGLICSQGGHLTEILQILEAFAAHQIFFATYYSAREEDLRKLGPLYLTNNIGTNGIRMLQACLWSLKILMVERPGAIVSTGAEIAIPFFYWSKVFGIRTIYIESYCRVDNLSITGRLTYPIADQFWVQWPQLLEKCGYKARFNGAVI